MSNGDRRIVVEIFSHEEAERIRQEMQLMEDRHRADMDRMEQRLLGLHNTLYEVIEALGNLRSKR